MKKFLCLLLAVMMLLACLPAMADEPTWKVIKTTGVVKCSNSTKVEGHVEIPAEVDGIKVMGLDYMAFMSNKKITGLTIPDSVRYIDRDALAGLSAVTSLTLPKKLVVVRSGSIRDMGSLESLVIPPTVQLVHGAIVRCSALKSVTFEGVCPLFPVDDTYKTFHDLHPDCVIYVPDDQVDAYKAAFAGDDEVLKRIQPSGKNAVVVDWTAPESDFTFDAATGTITKYNGTSGRVDIPAAIGGVAVRTIGSRAFASNYTMYVLNIPEGVEVLEGSCFSDCDGLVYVKFPTTLKTIEDYAFNSSNALRVVDWAEGLETLGKGVFASGPNLFHAKLPTTLRVIGDKAFMGAYLKTLTFGPNVETVGEMAFANNQLTEITYTGTAMPAYGAEPFKGNKKDATLTLADGTSQESYNAYVAIMAADFPTCVVNQPAAAPAPAATEVPAAAPEAPAAQPTGLDAYVGTWHMVYIATGGLEGDLRAMGLTAKLELNADGNGKLSGAADDSGKWYDDEGTVRFGKADTPLVLLDGGFLRYGSQLAGYMVFSKDANAVYDPNAAAPVPAAPAAPSAPAVSGAVNMGALANYTDKKYIAKTYTVAGFTTDASMLGAEYALTLYANNTCELSMAGFPMLLKWTQEADRLVIDYMGAATYYVTLTDAGINLDMNGMLLNMVAQ